MSKNALWGLVLIILLGGGALYAYSSGLFTSADLTPEPEGEQTICTADAMQCPDGSWVGRSGPKCEFVCPTPTSIESESSSSPVALTTRLNHKVSGLGVSLTPLEILEDSRCPLDVQCIQAGTVRVRAHIDSDLGSSVQEFTLDKPVTTETEVIKLTLVLPAPNSKHTITPDEYQFVFTIIKR